MLRYPFLDKRLDSAHPHGGRLTSLLILVLDDGGEQCAPLLAAGALGRGFPRREELWVVVATVEDECQVIAALEKHPPHSLGLPASRCVRIPARPYDLRHACLSTWLSAGVAPTQVAEWAGHSVDALLRVYAKCLDDSESLAPARIEGVIRPVAKTRSRGAFTATPDRVQLGAAPRSL